MLTALRQRVGYLYNRVRFFHVPPPNVGPVLLSGVALPTDRGIEILNDDRTHMEFVVRVLECCFGMTRQKAITHMVRVHTEGSTLIGYADASEAEQLVAHATRVARDRGFPLEFRLVLPAEVSGRGTTAGFQGV